MDDVEYIGTPDEEALWDQQIEHAMQDAENQPPMLRIKTAEFDAVHDFLLLSFNDGVRVAIPREDLQHLASTSKDVAASFEVEDDGYSIGWRAIDLDFSADGLRHGRTGNERWMAALEERRAATLAKAS